MSEFFCAIFRFFPKQTPPIAQIVQRLFLCRVTKENLGDSIKKLILLFGIYYIIPKPKQLDGQDMAP